MSELNGDAPAGAPHGFVNPLGNAQPTPFTYLVGSPGTINNEHAVQLTLMLVTGATILVMSATEARRLANALAAEGGGLIVPVVGERPASRPPI